ncbi:MAG TPA: MBL fold metallo-hydrolase [Vicinamibacteria bacterium]|nr:MBL fold metallo-hydrolase [Vicinamibacteria bacterium]
MRARIIAAAVAGVLICCVGNLAGDDRDLRVTFLGTGAPRPSFQRYGPSILIEAGEERLLVDASWGLRERLLQAGSFELITGIEHVLLTHLHYDHTIGLADLWLTGWLYGRRVPLRVEGPTGTTEFLDNTRRAFQWDVDYRILVGVPANGVSIEATDVSPGWVYEHNGLKITAFEVEHLPIDLKTRERLDFAGETLGYRIDFNGHSVVLSGDTRPSDRLVEQARGVDVLVHEVQVPSPGATRRRISPT